MRIYRIKDEYIDFLRKYDKKVSKNKKETRPFVGIVFEINNFKYFVPLSSPKEKYLKMNNRVDIFKLNDGELGVINLNNMIPVLEDYLLDFNIEMVEDINYRILLRKQLRIIKKNGEKIKGNAKKLYTIISQMYDVEYKSDINKKILKNRCVEYIKLEKIISDYINKNNIK